MGAHPYFPTRIEARAVDAFSANCVDLRMPVPGRVSEHLILQLGGAEVLMGSFRPDFKDSAEDGIARATGPSAFLAEKSHFSADDEIRHPASSDSRSLGPPAISILYAHGNRILLPI